VVTNGVMALLTGAEFKSVGQLSFSEYVRDSPADGVGRAFDR
jgi:hypothetical protein